MSIPRLALLGCFVVSLAAAGSAAAADGLADLIQAGDRGAALAAIRAGADVNAAQGDGTTPLHWAVYKVDAELVAQLLKRGAKANVVNDYGSSPLAEAVKLGEADLVDQLLDAGADVESPNQDGQTALMLAARAGALDVATHARRARCERERERVVARADAAHVGRRRQFSRARAAADFERRGRARARGRERLAGANHLRAARAVPPDGRAHRSALRCSLRLQPLRARDARGRRRHQPAEPGRRHAAHGRHRQLPLRHRAPLARSRRESARLGLVGPHGAVRRRRHEHLQHPRAANGRVRDVGASTSSGSCSTRA